MESRRETRLTLRGSLASSVVREKDGDVENGLPGYARSPRCWPREVVVALFAWAFVVLLGRRGDDTVRLAQPQVTRTAVPVVAARTVTPTTRPVRIVIPPPGVETENWPTYRDDEAGFTLKYPPGSELSDVDGAVRIDLPFAPGTNLVGKFVVVTAGPVPVGGCASQLVVGHEPGAATTELVLVDGVEFTGASGSEVAAGNWYDWTSYWTVNDGTCIVLDFVLHSTNPYSYPTPPPEFDVARESAVFSAILTSFRWLHDAPGTPTGAS